MTQSLNAKQKRQRLAQVLQQKMQQQQQSLQHFPLSFAQKRLWFLDQLQPEQTVYSLVSGWRLTGTLHLSILQQSLNLLVERHEILRSVFVEVAGQPMQRVLSHLSIPISVIDLQTIADAETIARSLLQTFAAQTFNLARSPLVRVAIVQLQPDQSLLLLALHHIIADYWSMGLLLHELTVIYQQRLQSQPIALAPLPIQYADYAVWQQTWLQSEARSRQLEYWQQQLADLTPLQLSTDFPRPPIQTFQGATQSFHLAPALTTALKTLSRQSNTTLFMTLLAAFKVLLYRYTGQTNIAVGSTISQRNRPEIEPLIGLFVNNLVLRSTLLGTHSFRSCLAQVREVTLAAYAHQDLPFEDLVEQLQTPRDLSQNPLFQVMFLLHNTPSRRQTLPGLTLTPLEHEQRTSRFDLSLDLDESESGIVGIVEYRTDLFAAATIDRLIAHFQTLLNSIVANPDQEIAQLPLLTPPEFRQFSQWNYTTQDLPKKSLLEQFEYQAVTHSESVAITFEQQVLTYQDLNQQVNQLAHYLAQFFIHPETRIGICLERSPQLVIALLAVWKIGAAYVPLDSSYPSVRLAFLIQDAAVAGVITTSDLCDHLPSDVTPLCLDQHAHAIAQQSTANPQMAILPPQLAYLIYTSGSTGTPKGVQVEHRGLMNLLSSFQDILGITPRDRWLAVTTIAFDIAGLELLLPLLCGAQVVIANHATTIDASKLEQAIATHDITLMQATPATWRMLITAGWQGKADLQILCGGEALDRPLAEQLLHRGCALWNLYGPTETTVWSAAHRVPPSTPTADLIAQTATVAIGHPIANTQFYVLDDALQPVPIGIPGHLYIGGIGLARGYWNRPDLTADRFIPSPFQNSKLKTQNSKFDRLYKTGDRVRHLPDGTLEYLGRSDDQIKLRGYRIELGEITACLQQHPHVEQAIVLLRTTGSSDSHLIAYFTPKHLDISLLRSFLASQLPAYMLPSHWIGLAQLPLTPNGKVDRQTLLTLTPLPYHPASLPPHHPTPTAEILATLWSTLLHQPQIRPTDNFFELGGHSLLATQLVAQIRQVFGRDVPLRSVFEAPNLTDLAGAIATATEARPPITPGLAPANPPLSFAQERFWVMAQLEPQSPSYNIPLAMQVQGRLDPAIVRQSVEFVMQRHAILRTAFPGIEGQPVQVVSPVAMLTVPVIDLSSLPPERQAVSVQQVTQAEAQQPFDLAIAPLLRVTVVQLATDNQVLMLTVHHIVADAGSMQLFVQEVVQAYDAIERGEMPVQPELTLQYADFATWQQQWLQGGRLQISLNYWQQQLAGIPALLELPSDRPRPAVQQFRGAVHRCTLNAELTTRLRQFSQQSHSTLFMTLLTGLAILFHRYSGSDDIAIGSPIANRPQAELEPLIGCFANTLVLRTDLSGNPSVTTLMYRVRDMAMAAYTHQDIPFEQVIEALQPERSLSHSPLFQVMLVLQNLPPTPHAPRPTPSRQWHRLDSNSGSTKFDLTWMLTETPEGIIIRLEYDTALFDASTMQRMSHHFETILQAMVQSPEHPIATLPLLSDLELHQLLVEWNQTQRDYPTGYCLHELFAAQVERTPDAIAVVDAHHSLTYAELNAQANQLAHYLQSLGVSPDTPVGVCLERTHQLVIGLLGILKAGAAYLPLDPTYPAERLQWMLKDAAVSVLVTQRSLLPQLPDSPAAIVDLETAPLPSQPTTNPKTSLTPTHLAYLIYTSGSTGVPKGIEIAHSSPVTLVQWAQETFTTAQLSGVLAATSICFDLSVFEIFVPLCSGGTMLVIDSILNLGEFPAAAAVTLINTVPSAARELLRLNAIPPNVCIINLAGEALSGTLVQQLYQQPQIEAIFNLYGPSEDTTYSTAIQLPPTASSPPIGHPIANTQAYILDAHLQAVPIGVVGELHLGGAGLARGYWNRPDLTAERFIPNPFARRSPLAPLNKGGTSLEIPLNKGDLGGSLFSPGRRGVGGEVIYKTGDRARYLPNGNIEFLGRADHQVKLRGFRIELGEIAAILDRHPAIIQSVVTLQTNTTSPDISDHAQLVAYIIPDSSAHWEKLPAELRQYLATHLPAYMVPAQFIYLEQFPLTPNGKLDRKSLPVHSPTPPLPHSSAPPLPIRQQQLLQIWQTLLGQDAIDIHDNFFALGGDSILAIQAIAKANQLGLHLTPRQLFQAPTIAQLASLVQTTPTIQVEQGTVTGIVPLTPIQQWFFEQTLQHPHHWNQSVFLTVQTPLHPHWLRQAVRALLHHHDALRSQFQHTAIGWQQIQVAPTETIPCLYVDLSDLPEIAAASVMSAIATDLQANLNLETGDLLRVAYFDRGGSTYARGDRLLIVLHHLVVDGVSWRILLEDLQQAYTQLSQHQPLQLPPKTTPFKTWAEHLIAPPSSQSLSQSGREAKELEAELDYWLCDRWQTARSLPLDQPQGSNRMADLACVSVSLSQEDTEALLQVVPNVYRTQIMDSLLTALVLTVQPWIGDAPLVMELEGHGRTEAIAAPPFDLSRTIGWFTTLYPILLHLPPQAGFATAIKTIKEQLRQIPNQGIGYGIGRYGNDLDLCSHLRSLPPATLRFNYLGQIDNIFFHVFAPAPEFGGMARSSHNERDIALEINGLVLQNQLRLDWLYSQAQYQRATIQQMADRYVATVRSLIHHCLTPEAGGFTPSDFPQMELSQAELDDLLANL